MGDTAWLDAAGAATWPLVDRYTGHVGYKRGVKPNGLDDDPAVIDWACKFGLEGIVSKRRDLAYESGKSRRWLKTKNPQSPAMLRLSDG